MHRYNFTVQWSDDDECYIARVVEFPGVAAHGDTPDDALKEVQVSLELAIEVYQEEG
jgi:predicted RNase H-like HicB family nuclease